MRVAWAALAVATANRGAAFFAFDHLRCAVPRGPAGEQRHRPPDTLAPWRLLEVLLPVL